MSLYAEPGFECPECVDAAPYVLGALEIAELSEYKEHLASCPACHALVADLRAGADMLPATSPPAVASQELRERVLVAVRSEAELLKAAGEQADQTHRPARRWRRQRLSLVSAAAVIALGVAFAIAVGVGSPTAERVISAQHIAASAPGASAALHERSGRVVLVVSGMPQAALGRIYQVWLRRRARSAQPTDALFGVTGRGRGAVAVPGGLRGVKEVMVTSEPLGGSAAPTSPPLIRVLLET